MDVIIDTITKERIDLKVQLDDINEKLLDFYENRQLQDKYLNYGFKREEGVYDTPMVSYNITKKIINKISLVYKEAPERTIGDSDVYEQWIAENPRFNLAIKEAERYKNLIGKILFRPRYMQDYKKWVFYIETYYQAHFLEGDPTNPVAYSYPIKQELSSVSRKEVREDWWVFWSDELHFEYIPGTNKQRPAAELSDFNNPFGIIPLVEMRDSFPVNQYDCSGAIDLVQANQAINVALNDLNVMVHYQAFDQMVGKGINEADVAKIKTGPRKIVLIGDPEADLSLLGYNPKIIDSIEAIKFQFKSIAQMYNINMEVSLDTSGPVSGFSLLVQNIDLLEAREDDVEVAAVGEKELYKVLQAIQGYYKTPPKFPEGELNVDFQDIRFPVNQTEELARWDWEIEKNAETVIDYMQSKNPDLDDDEALEQYKKNKELNGKLTARDMLKETAQGAGIEIVPGQNITKGPAGNIEEV